MAEKQWQRTVRPATAEERERHAALRQQLHEEFPPAESAERLPTPPGIPTQIRQAREAQGLTWFALAQQAGLASGNAVRDMEAGRDAPLSALQAVASVLGLRLELIPEQV